MTFIGIVVLAAVVIAGAAWLALGLCASSAARDDMESRLELPAEDQGVDHPRPQPEVIIRLAAAEAEGVVRP